METDEMNAIDHLRRFKKATEFMVQVTSVLPMVSSLLERMAEETGTIIEKAEREGWDRS